MNSYPINFSHFFSTLPNEEFFNISSLFDQLRVDLDSGIYHRISTIYGATTYSDYVSAAILYYQNLPELEQLYPELFI